MLNNVLGAAETVVKKKIKTNNCGCFITSTIIFSISINSSMC